jgi:hypothetical protein
MSPRPDWHIPGSATGWLLWPRRHRLFASAPDRGRADRGAGGRRRRHVLTNDAGPKLPVVDAGGNSVLDGEPAAKQLTGHCARRGTTPPDTADLCRAAEQLAAGLRVAAERRGGLSADVLTGDADLLDAASPVFRTWRFVGSIHHSRAGMR